MRKILVLSIWFKLAFMTTQVSAQKRFLALGDSYTIGEAVEESQRWPSLFIHELNENGEFFNAPEIVAKTGWTTDELLAQMKDYSFQPPYDLVSLLIGVNNQYRGYSIETYRQEFKMLLNRAIDLADGKIENVFVVSIPDWGATPFAKDRNTEVIAAEILNFNLVNKEIAAEKGVLWIDIFEISQLANNDSSLTASDGLHPSVAMYQLWTNEILKKRSFR